MIGVCSVRMELKMRLDKMGYRQIVDAFECQRINVDLLSSGESLKFLITGKTGSDGKCQRRSVILHSHPHHVTLGFKNT